MDNTQETRVGWWQDMIGLVSETDLQLAAIEPYGTPDDLRSLGQILKQWQTEFPQARHIWGLSDLLAGQPPRTPPIYLGVPYPTASFESCYEPVALVFVAEGTDLETAGRHLSERLGSFSRPLARIQPPQVYCAQHR